MKFSAVLFSVLLTVISWPSYNSFASTTYDVALNDQIQVAECAYDKMDYSSKLSLSNATSKWIKDRNDSRLRRAFEADVVPESIAKCIKEISPSTTSSHATEDDFYHFYDYSERWLRVIFMKKTLSSSGVKRREIEKFLNDTKNKFLASNRAYYSTQEPVVNNKIDETVLLVYKCYFVALRLDKNPEADAISEFLNKTKSSQSLHKAYMAEALKIISKIEREANGDSSGWYDYVCKEPVSRLKKMLEQNMF